MMLKRCIVNLNQIFISMKYYKSIPHASSFNKLMRELKRVTVVILRNIKGFHSMEKFKPRPLKATHKFLINFS